MSEEKKVEMPQETMADFEDEINASFVTYKEGDVVRGTVVSVEEEEVIVDLQSFSQGVIPGSEYSDDPDFHAMDEIRVGDVLEAVVMYEDEQGRTVLSLKQARAAESWELLRDAMERHQIYETRVKSVVPSGVTAYVEGIRGFIPASQLALSYVEQEELEDYVGKMLKVCVITADETADKLVLSAKEVAREEAAKTHEAKLNALQKGFITEGTVTRIESYGCFVEFGEDLTGLVHISQICNKFLKSPKEVVKLGMKVKVKVLDVNDGKIRLSMKEAEDIAPELEQGGEEPEENTPLGYTEGEATTSLAGLLKGIHLD
ncbi:MAG: S1 RNA-binding domain-containing protein [Roseburia sp.]|nr:S1 RNA-binding domain-containing protein [Roseburia sp.]